MEFEASYICDVCGESIVVPIDPTSGSEQEYVEDCPVCCHPHLLWVTLDENGEARVVGRAE